MSEKKRTAILAATVDLVAEEGFHGATLEMIAGRSGVPVATIYRHFVSKNELIVQTYLDLELRLYQTAMEGAGECRPFKAKFLLVAENLLRYCISAPLQLRFFEQFRLSPYFLVLRRGETVANLKARATHDIFPVFTGRQMVKDLPPAVLFCLGLNPIFTIAGHHHDGSIHLDEELIGHVVGCCWDAISPRRTDSTLKGRADLLE